jgi:hypothetical protein
MSHRFRLCGLALLLLCLRGTVPAAPLEESFDLQEADERVLKSAGIKAEPGELLAFFRQRTLSAADRTELERWARQLGSEDFNEREEAGRKILTRGASARPYLEKAAQSDDAEVVRRARELLGELSNGPGPVLTATIARTLARKRVAEAVPVLLEYLPFAEDATVEDEVCGALVGLTPRAGPPSPALRAALTDSRTVCRGAAGFVLGRSPDDGLRDAVRKLLADREPRVRFRAAQGLLAGQDKTAVPALIGLLLEPPGELAWQVEDILSRIGGEGQPVVPAGDTAENRTRRRDLWLTWWDQNKAKIDLARLDQEPAYRGLTLVPEMHANKVWECTANGKVEWELATGLQCPIDAQVLPGNRLLVAELNGNRVTERDRSGKVLWEHAVNTPIACQRLPNGHTWISTNHRFFIVSPDGKEVSAYEPENGFFIHSAQRLRNGHVVIVSMDGEVREIDPGGRVLHKVPLAVRGSWSGIEGVPGNRYLVVNNGHGLVQEVDTAGKVIWEYKLAGACYASRLPNGNTLVVNNSSGILEVDREGKTVWDRPVGSSVWRAHRR